MKPVTVKERKNRLYSYKRYKINDRVKEETCKKWIEIIFEIVINVRKSHLLTKTCVSELTIFWFCSKPYAFGSIVLGGWVVTGTGSSLGTVLTSNWTVCPIWPFTPVSIHLNNIHKNIHVVSNWNLFWFKISI